MAATLGVSGLTWQSVWIPRTLLCFILFTALFTPSMYNSLLFRLYSHLYRSSIYRFSGIETVETMLCYIILEPLYTYKFGRNPSRRVDVRGAKPLNEDAPRPKVPKMRRPSKRLGELLVYAAPLLCMDLVMIKKFAGVPVSDIRRSGGYVAIEPNRTEDISPSFLLPTVHNFTLQSPLQLQRALPLAPPSSRRLVVELLVSFFIYDSLFFFIHVAFHRIPLLARIHRPHHTHAEIHPQVTNRLSVTERLSLILLANFSLNIIGSHVLTRTAFVPFFVYLLIEVHSGLDLEWGYDKIMPGGWGAGSQVHAIHHRSGDRAFQPFFAWWDTGLSWLEQGREKVA